jgi:hypothetical protein
MVIRAIAAADNKVSNAAWNYNTDFPVFNIKNFRATWVLYGRPDKNGPGPKTKNNETCYDFFLQKVYATIKFEGKNQTGMSFEKFLRHYDIELGAATLEKDADFDLLMKLLRGLDSHFPDDHINHVEKFKNDLHVVKDKINLLLGLPTDHLRYILGVALSEQFLIYHFEQGGGQKSLDAKQYMAEFNRLVSFYKKRRTMRYVIISPIYTVLHV